MPAFTLPLSPLPLPLTLLPPPWPPPRPPPPPQAFTDCMNWSNGDMGACQEWFDRMQSCRRAMQQ